MTSLRRLGSFNTEIGKYPYNQAETLRRITEQLQPTDIRSDITAAPSWTCFGATSLPPPSYLSTWLAGSAVP